MKSEDLYKLSEPFPQEDVEWRALSSRIHPHTKQPEIILAAYITNRAVMNRLDSVCGLGGWQNQFADTGNGFMCGISINVDGEWITKWDGAGFKSSADVDKENEVRMANWEVKGRDKNYDKPSILIYDPDLEYKSSVSGAEKRAAVQWGIGRYLYELPKNNQAVIVDKNEPHMGFVSIQGTWYYWNPPSLPEEALPENERGKQKQATKQQPVTPKQETKPPVIPPKQPADDNLTEPTVIASQRAEDIKSLVGIYDKDKPAVAWQEVKKELSIPSGLKIAQLNDSQAKTVEDWLTDKIRERSVHEKFGTTPPNTETKKDPKDGLPF